MQIEKKLTQYWLKEGERIALANFPELSGYTAWYLHEETREIYYGLRNYSEEIALLTSHFAEPIPEGQTERVARREKQLRRFGYDPQKLRVIFGL
jgi:hypothetical protein